MQGNNRYNLDFFFARISILFSIFTFQYFREKCEISQLTAKKIPFWFKIFYCESLENSSINFRKPASELLKSHSDSRIPLQIFVWAWMNEGVVYINHPSKKIPLKLQTKIRQLLFLTLKVSIFSATCRFSAFWFKKLLF